jgi:hypothetical protein
MHTGYDAELLASRKFRFVEQIEQRCGPRSPAPPVDCGLIVAHKPVIHRDARGARRGGNPFRSLCCLLRACAATAWFHGRARF